MSPRSVKGFSEIFAPYDGFILDLWGVIHDGVSPLPGAIPALEMLKKAKRKVWLLSNAPRRAHAVAEKMTDMGVTPDLYDGLLTSGEASWQALNDTLLEKWGRKIYHLGKSHDNSVYDGLDVELMDDPAKADCLIVTGVRDFNDRAGQYTEFLKACAKRKMPMLCANPDRIVHIEDKLVVCAGTLADMYEEMEGGEVAWFGKPYRAVYSHCLKALGSGKILAVGDSMVTDIAGATGAGIDSALVTSGIHREEFDENDIASFLSGYPYQPTYMMESFCWEPSSSVSS